MERPCASQPAAWRTAPRSPAASAPRSARRGSGSRRRGRAPSGSRRAAARRPTARATARPDRPRGRSAPTAARAGRAPPARPSRSRHSGSVPSMMLSSTVRLSASVKCWCTMPMPAASAAAGSPGGSGLPKTSTRAGVGDVVAEQDVHQRRLAGAVLAEQREHLARARGRSEMASLATSGAEALGDARRGAGRAAGPRRLTASAASLQRRLRLGVVDLDGELAVQDRLLLSALTLAIASAGTLPSNVPSGASSAAVVLHHRVLAVVLGLELAALDRLDGAGRSSAPCSTAPRRRRCRDTRPACR